MLMYEIKCYSKVIKVVHQIFKMFDEFYGGH